MKQKLLLFAFTLLSTMLFSQAVPMAFKDWETNAGIQAMFQKNITKVDASGNVYTAGATLNANGKYDIFLTKVSSGGTLLYTKQINGTSNDQDFALGLALSGTDVYMTGSITNGTVTPIPELFLVKYNSSGTQQFFSTYSGGYGDVGKDLVVNITYSTCIVTGASYNSGFTSDMVVVAFNSNTGAQNWVNGYSFPYGANDAGIKIATKSNNCTVTSAVTAGVNQYKLVTTQYTLTTGSGSGTLTAGATATSSVEIVSDLFQDASGNIFLIGATQQNAGQGYDIYVAKVTSSLTIAYETTINGFSGSSLDDFGKGITVDASGNAYISCVTTHSTQGKNLTVVKLNSSGTVQWTKNINGTFNGNDGGADLAIDASNNIYVTGYQTISAGNTDIYTVKLANATGNIIWEKFEASPLNDEGTNIVLASNDVIVAGSHELSVGNYEYVTYKYVQKDVITPTDFAGETPKNYFMFFRNKGQLINTQDSLVPDIKFYTYQTYPSFYFKDKIQHYVFSKIDTLRSSNDTIHRIDLTFTGSNESAKTYAMEEQKTGYLNYYLKHTGSNGITGILPNKRLLTTELYNNIDLMTTNNQDGIKYYFIVKPGADMRDIKLEYTGASSYSLNGTTNALSINSTVGNITFDKPIAYQLTSANATVAVTSFSPTWTVDGASNKYKFNNGTYTSSLTLIIQVVQKTISVSTPTNTPVWGTSFGGTTGNAEAYDITVDKITGNIYTTGYCSSQNFPHTSGFGFQDWSGANDAFMSFFDNDYEYKYTTLYGGTGIDKGNGVAYSASDDKIYICGQTTGTTAIVMPLSGSATTYTNSSSGNNFCFISRFNGSDGKMEWSTRYGVNMGEGKKIKSDANGNIYVIGDAQLVFSTTMTCLPNNSGLQPVCTPGGGAYYQPISVSANTPLPNSVFYSDGYIARFNSQTALTWSTLFGGNGDEYMKDIHVDDVNNKLYVVGGTYSTYTTTTNNCDFSSPYPYRFPICDGGGTFYARNTINGNFSQNYSDGFFAKFNLSTLALEGCSLFGGSAEDVITDVVTDNNNNLFITGYTNSGAFTTNNTSYNGQFPLIQSSSSYTQTFKGSLDAFVAKFSGAGQTLEWSTYLGDLRDDIPSGIAINTQSDDIYVSGNTKSCSFPSVTAGAYYSQLTHADDPCSPLITDGYVTTFNSSGSIRNSTFFGGKGPGPGTLSYGDNIAGVAAWRYRIYVGGGTYSTSNFPFANPGTFNPYVNTTYAPNRYRVFYGQISSDAVGIEELTNNHNTMGSMLIYPNPTNSKISFEWQNTTSKKATISIYNLMGQTINTFSLKESKGLNKEEINVSDLTFGLYLVVVKTETQTLNAKFIKD